MSDIQYSASDEQATQRFHVLNHLCGYCDQTLTPDLIDELTQNIVTDLQLTPFSPGPSHLGLEAREFLNLLLDDLDALIDNSEGVAGLHLNGDIASWESLREGGRFESWLMRMDEARAFLDSTMDNFPSEVA